MFAIACPQCGKTYDVPGTAIGKGTTCAKCGAGFRISQPGPTRQPVAAPAHSHGTSLYAVGGSVLAVLLIIAAGLGLFLWDRAQDKKATAAYQRYTKLCSEWSVRETLAGIERASVEGHERELADAGAEPSEIPRLKKRIARGKEMQAAYKSQADDARHQASILETSWSVRWASLGLPTYPK